MRIGIRAALLFAVASLASGCPAPGYRSGGRPELQRTLVLPLNVVAAMPDELADRAGYVDGILLDYLEERGKSVQTIGYRDATAAWRTADSDCRAARARKCDNFLGVAPFAARRLRTDQDYDVLIVPYLLLRNARTNGYIASFDGVERPVKSPSYAPPYGPYGPYAYPYGYPYGAYGYGGGGRIRAASIKVYGFSAEGKRLFAGIGGLDVVDQIGASDEGPGAYTVEVRENLLRDPQEVREGVARALSNFLPRPRG